jgi:putative restriction endonuclease
MEVISKAEIFNHIFNAIGSCGWDIAITGNTSSHPLKLTAKNGQTQENLLIYVWNVTHGGKTRSEDEYRIQITGVKTLHFEEDTKTLLLGIALHEGKVIFASYNPYKHKTFGASPSLQIKRQTLEEAASAGVAFQEKTKGDLSEIVIAFIPEQFMQYITSVYPEYHQEHTPIISKNEAAIILKVPIDRPINFEDLEKLPSERRMVVRKINQYVREQKFRQNLLYIYKRKCVICGLQANLTEGCHIVPVKGKGLDDIRNGVLFCKNHHKAYDSGLLAISEDYNILLDNKHAEFLKEHNLDNKLDEFIRNSRVGETILLPDNPDFYPKKEYLRKNLEIKGMQ